MKKVLLFVGLVFLFSSCDTGTNTSNNSGGQDFIWPLLGIWDSEDSITGGYTEKFVLAGETYTFTSTEPGNTLNASGKMLYNTSNMVLFNFNGNDIVVEYFAENLYTIYFYVQGDLKKFIRYVP